MKGYQERKNTSGKNAINGRCVSPDRKWIVFTVSKPEGSELIMIEDFQ